MVKPYPDAAQMARIEQPTLPASVLNAARVMYAGAVVGAVHAIIYVLTQSAEKTAIEKKHPHFTASDVNSLQHVTVAAGVIVALLGAILFIWIARSCQSGKNWARITGTVLFVIAILGTIYELTTAETVTNLIFKFAGCLIGLVAVVLLWQRSSNAYFAYFKRPQF
jgi:heme A synthase